MQPEDVQMIIGIVVYLVGVGVAHGIMQHTGPVFTDKYATENERQYEIWFQAMVWPALVLLAGLALAAGVATAIIAGTGMLIGLMLKPISKLTEYFIYGIKNIRKEAPKDVDSSIS
jgi:hypothetical protein